MKELKGIITAAGISAAITPVNKITASIYQSNSRPNIETYTGEYEATPKDTPQVMATKNKLLKEDFTVNEILYFEVTNTANGTTVTIGG